MRPFLLHNSNDRAVAAKTTAQNAPGMAALIAGGTTMLDLMKLDVLQPSTLVEISDRKDRRLSEVAVDGAGLRLGALVKMADAAADPRVLRDYPVVAQSLSLAASPQIRNMATLGGNVLQRTRCEYFRNVSTACNKRAPGSGCAALDGFNRSHAVLGASDACIATYPGDFAQALIALDAQVQIENGDTHRTLAFTDLHRPPEQTPHIETNLKAGDLITAFFIPASKFSRRSVYLKIRDRQSYQFALASAAVALDLSGDRVNSARIALGGVATKPWRAAEAEAVLHGKTLNEDTATQAARAAFAGAKARTHNTYKIELGRETLVRALLAARAMEIAG